MQWIKASERLPEVPDGASGLIIIREIENKDNYKTSWYGNHKGKGSNSLLKRHPNRYEWLSETPSHEGKDADYWKQRCLAAEAIFHHVDFGLGVKDTSQLSPFGKAYDQWQSLKQKQ